jgi:uncharacterized protein YxeA
LAKQQTFAASHSNIDQTNPLIKAKQSKSRIEHPKANITVQVLEAGKHLPT